MATAFFLVPLRCRTITGMVGCVKQTLSSYQKKPDYKPENPGVAECTQVRPIALDTDTVHDTICILQA